MADRILGGRALTNELKKLAGQTYTTLDDGTLQTRAEKLADLIWKLALGYTETTEYTDDNGNRRRKETTYPPVAWAMQYVFERTEGKAPLAQVEEGSGMRAAEKVRELARQRINALSKKVTVPLPKK